MAVTATKSVQLVQLSARRRAELLDETRWSNDFLWEDIEVLAEYMEMYKVLKGATIFVQGDTQLFMCLIHKGKVDVIKEDSRQQKRVLSTIGPDKTLGEMALIDGQPRSASAVAADETTMFVLTKEKFIEMMEARPKVWGAFLFKICKQLSQRLRETSGELVDILNLKG